MFYDSVEHSLSVSLLCLHLLHSSPAYPGLTQLLTTEQTMTLRCVLLVAGLAAPALQDNVGWRSFLQENTQEFQDLPLAWDGDTEVPAWLSGTYVRNGPAQVGLCIIISDKQIRLLLLQISFGSKRRVLTSWLDGFAKLHSFKMSGSTILYRYHQY